MNHTADVFAVAALSLASTFSMVHTEEQKVAKTDVARGETIFNNGAPTNNMPAYTNCHGADDSSAIDVNPELAGQHAEYVGKQLKDLKAKTDRNHPVMSLYASTLSGQDMKDIEAYLDRQPAWELGSARSKDTIGLGQKLYRSEDAKRDIVMRAGCHDPTGTGIPAQYPRIVSQFSGCTEAQLVAFQSGTRKNSVQMHDLADRMTTQQIKTVADYITGLC